MTAEKNALQATVDGQEISPSDVDRMNAERDQLAISLESINVKLDSINKTIWEKEIAIQKKMDNVEKIVQEYNSLLYKLGYVGSTAKPELGQELEFYMQATLPQDMISIDLKNIVRVSLNKHKESFNFSSQH